MFKKILALTLTVLMLATLCVSMASCGGSTPTPTPTPTPFTGEISSIEIAQAYDETGALFATDELVAQRGTAVYVRLSTPLGHTPDERDSLTVGRDGELVGVFAADDEQEFFNMLCAKVFQRSLAAAVQCDNRVAFVLSDFTILVGGAIYGDLQMFAGSGGGFDDGRKKQRCAAARQQDVVPTENFRAAHDGAFVVRIFDGIQKNHARRADHVRKRRVRKCIGI